MASCESQSSSNAKEIELKLEFDADAAPRILSHPIFEGPPPKTRELVSIYYDTGASDLRNAGVFLRVRSTGDGYVQTIKSAKSEGEFLERNEWECPVPTHEPNLDAAEELRSPCVPRHRAARDLWPRATTRRVAPARRVASRAACCSEN